MQDSHKHAKTCIYMSLHAYETPKDGILISTLKHASYDRAYETTKYGILISTLKYANMSVLMRHQNTGFS